jgi:hypothetical protein
MKKWWWHNLVVLLGPSVSTLRWSLASYYFSIKKMNPYLNLRKFGKKVMNSDWLLFEAKTLSLRSPFLWHNYLQLLQLTLCIVFLDIDIGYGNNQQLVSYRRFHVISKKTYIHWFAIKCSCNWKLYIIQALLSGNGKLLSNFPKYHGLEPHLTSNLLYFVDGGSNYLFICFAFM